ncbi:MAG: large conductance mechanosensitive channel protein MscL [Clostridiales bacterium]|jgi:large conductance mechanosensitive channel|nr:large conductance mechanosensitive channel protein MscL [Clostridiales bacterium]
MKKLWNEFKTFINKGSVIDLAVGMIIGSAFTAIVNSLVNGILKPLINLIPISPDGTGLQTVLRGPVLDDSGKVISEALILDWGGVISAIITFFVTALVLFAIIKGINKLKEAGETATQKITDMAKQELDKKKHATETAAAKPAPAETVEEPVAETLPETVEEKIAAATDGETVSPKVEALLEEIVALLKAQKD